MRTAVCRRAGWVVLGGLASLFPAGAQVTLLSHSTLVSDTAMGPSLTAVAPAPVGSIVSGDGRYIAFLSRAMNGVAGQIDTPGTLDAFLYDRVARSSWLVSHVAGAVTTAAGVGETPSLAISRDGEWVAFTSPSAQLVAGQSDTNGGTDVFLYRRATGVVSLVSHRAASAVATGNQGSGAGRLALSNDGGRIAFSSFATDLSDGQVAGTGPQIFLFDRASNLLRLASHQAGSGVTPANGAADRAALSGDGRFVAFSSLATDLVAGQVDANGARDVFLFDATNGEILLVSHARAGVATAGGGESGELAISGDGSSVAYLSRADDLVAGQADPAGVAWDAYLFDRATGANRLVSHAAGRPTTSGNAAVEPGEIPALSDDGRYTVFASAATDLVAGQVDAAGGTDLFLFDRTTGDATLISHTGGSSPLPTAGNLGAGAARISADGGAVAFVSGSALGYGPDLGPPLPKVFLFRRATGGVAIVSRGFDFIGPALGSATQPALSADGRYVAFTSTGWDLELNDTNGTADVFVFDSSGPFGSNTFVSRRAAGMPSLSGNAASFTSPHAAASLSADGRYALFSTVSTDAYVSFGAAPGPRQLVAADRLSGATRLVSQVPGCLGCPSGGDVVEPALSADGVKAAFAATALHTGPLVPADRSQVFSVDVSADNPLLLSAAAGAPTRPANDASGAPVLSADGRASAFESLATDLVSGTADTNLASDVFLRPPTGATVLVSHAAGAPGVAANGASSHPRISGDGRFIAFDSLATNLATGMTDVNDSTDVFLYDAATGSSLLVTRTAALDPGSSTRGGRLLDLSRDGRFVLFLSSSVDVIFGQNDGNSADDLFLFDRTTGRTQLVSRASGPAPGTANAATLAGALSADGRYVAFLSAASDLVPGQTDGALSPDVFLFDRLTAETGLVSHAAGSTTATGNGPALSLAIDGEGRFVAWTGLATDVVAGQIDDNWASDVFVYDRTTGANRLVSRTLADATRAAGGPSTDPVISADGRSILFTSAAGDLTAGDYNGTTDVFLDRAPTHPGRFFTLTPCRATDSRVSGAALASNTAWALPVFARCGIPSTARAVSLNLTIVAGNASGFVTLYAGGQPPPDTSTLNFRSGQVKANNAVVPLALDGSGTLALRASYSGTGPVQVILDVNGYFE